jgi:hypothetical protein
MNLATYIRTLLFVYLFNSLYNFGVRYYLLTSAQRP